MNEPAPLEGVIELTPACSDCPIGGRDQPGQAPCPHVAACDELCARMVYETDTACGLARRFAILELVGDA